RAARLFPARAACRARGHGGARGAAPRGGGDPRAVPPPPHDPDGGASGRRQACRGRPPARHLRAAGGHGAAGGDRALHTAAEGQARKILLVWRLQTVSILGAPPPATERQAQEDNSPPHMKTRSDASDSLGREALGREAAAWLSLLSSGRATEADAARLKEWRERTPDHARAYAEAARAWRLMAPAAQALRRQAPGLDAPGPDA